MRGEDGTELSTGLSTTGITPACAGKTGRTRVGVELKSDHPRMRGEDPPAKGRTARPSGSPPHARGRLRHDGRPHAAFRITPACAGKTRMDMLRRDVQEDHPRMRGEDHYGGCGHGSETGSPPHARGRHKALSLDGGHRRITPHARGRQ